MAKIPRNCSQILCDDLHKIEHHENKSSKCGKSILKKKKLSWEDLKIALLAKEPIRTMGSL
jgi:hypothetical protein